MNAPISTSEPPGPFDLAGLGAPGRSGARGAALCDRPRPVGPSGPAPIPRQPAGGRGRLCPGGAWRPLRAARAGGIVAGAADRQCNARRHRHRRLVRGAARRTGTAPWRRRYGAAGAGRQPRLCRPRLRHRASDPVARIGSADPALSRRRRHRGIACHDAPRPRQPDPRRDHGRQRCAGTRHRGPAGPALAGRAGRAVGTDRLPHRRRAHHARRQPAPALAADAGDRRGAGRACAERPARRRPVPSDRAHPGGASWPGSAARRARRAGRRRRLRAQDAAARPRAHAAVRAAEGLCLLERLRLPRDRARRRLVAPAGPALHRRRGQDGRAARHGVPRTALACRRSRDAR